MDGSLDEIDSQSHHYEKDIHFPFVYGRHLALIGSYQRTGSDLFKRPQNLVGWLDSNIY